MYNFFFWKLHIGESRIAFIHKRTSMRTSGKPHHKRIFQDAKSSCNIHRNET